MSLLREFIIQFSTLSKRRYIPGTVHKNENLRQGRTTTSCDKLKIHVASAVLRVFSIYLSTTAALDRYYQIEAIAEIMLQEVRVVNTCIQLKG